MREFITTIMRPLVRLLLRHGVAYAEFSAITRNLYVDVAESEFRIEGRKQSLSRIAVLTGITRREVKKILDDPGAKLEATSNHNRAARVFFGWLHDAEFCDDAGNPLVLPIGDTEAGTFSSLVRKYSGDMPVRAVLDEMIRVGAVQRIDNDAVEMTSTGYVPSGSSDDLLDLSSQAIADLIRTLDHNDQHPPQESHLQLTVNYDNVTREGADIFRKLSREKSKEVLLYLDRFLATQDRDANPAVRGIGKVRTGLSIFYFEEALDEDISDNEK